MGEESCSRSKNRNRSNKENTNRGYFENAKFEYINKKYKCNHH